MAASCFPNEFSATHTYRPESDALTLLIISFDLTDVSVNISSTLYLLTFIVLQNEIQSYNSEYAQAMRDKEKKNRRKLLQSRK